MLNRLKRFMFRAFFEGAKRTAATRDFANASTQDFEELARYDRDQLRARARWLKANNPIMSNIDETIINNVIGKGIEAQISDTNVQKMFNEWCKDCDLTGRLHFNDMQRVIPDTRMVDGEIFIYKKITKNGLKIQLIEADQLDTYQGENGLELDSNGKVTAYHFKTDSGTIKVDAKYIINYYKAGRPSQYRGISEYSRSIIDIKNFQGFVTANIQSLRARANIAYVVEGNNVDPYGSGVTTNDDETLQEINGAFVHYLNTGESIKALDSSTTPINFGEFVESTVRMIAVSRNVSYELAFRDFSRVNFSSARASIIQDNKRFDAEQRHFINYVLNPIFDAWFDNEVLRGTIGVQKPTVNWITPVREWVKPTEDLKVTLDLIDRNLKTYTEAAKERGVDFEEILKQRQEEEKIVKKYKLNKEDNNA